MFKFLLDGTEYSAETLSDEGLNAAQGLRFCDKRIEEKTNMLALLTRAKNSYVEGIKTEILANKSGFLFGDD